MKITPLLAVGLLGGTLASSLVGQEEDFVTGTRVSALGNLAGNLVWSHACNESTSRRSLVKRMPASGGPTFTVLDYSTCNTANSRLRSRAPFDIDNNSVYLDFAGNIVKRARWNTASEVVGNATDPAKLPLDGPAAWAGTSASGYFFWSEDEGLEFAAYSRLYRNSTTSPSDSNETILDLSSSPGSRISRILAHSANRLTVLTVDRDLIQANRTLVNPPFGQPFAVWLTSTIRDGDCTAAVEHDGDLYYTTLSSDSRSVIFRRAPVTDPANDTVLHLEFNIGGHTVDHFDTDGEFLYYQLWQAGSGPLKRYEIGTGPAVEIGGPYTSPLKDLREEGSYLFWVKNSTTIARLPVNALAIERDLAVTGLEVIQVNQDAANTVPLIADKTTQVRVFTRLLSSSAGEAAIDSWPGVLLSGSRDGSSLPGSPLSPLRARRITSDSKLRTNPEHGFRFRLPDSWTTGGPITLTGTVNPTRVYNETDRSNNSRSFVANFENRDDICVVIYPLRHTRGTTGAWTPTLQRMLTRAETVLPTPRLRVFFPGGDPLEEYEFPFGAGPFEISQSDEDAGKVLRKLNKRQTFKRNPAGCETHFAGALFNGFPQRQLNGVARRDAFVSYIDLGSVSPDDDPLDINSAKSGITMAHELGHNHGRKHVNCPAGAPARPTSSYPHFADGMQCNFASPGTMGYDPIANQYFAFDYAGDLLSYAHFVPKPRWPSDFTWNGIRAELGLNPPPAPGTAPPAPGGALGNFCYVAGLFDGNGSFQLDYAWKMDSVAHAQALAELTNAEINDYELVGRDQAGSVLFAVPAPAWFVNESEDEFGLEAIIPDHSDLAELQLRRINNPAIVLAVLGAGTSPPALAITSPLGGFFSGDLPISWTASDSDGDELQFQVRFSSDKGLTWTVIADDLRDTSLVIPAASLGGSKQCVLEITASDGLHSTVATSNAFELPASTPQAAFFYDLGDGLLNEVHGIATVFPGQPVTLHGYGHDLKDGSLDREDLSWTLNGPEFRNGTGATFFNDDLAPGSYDLTLTATNSSGIKSLLEGVLIVTPNCITTTPNPVILDGRPTEFAYQADEWAVPLRYDDGNTAQLRAVHHDGHLYFALAALPRGSRSDEFVTFYLDLTGAGSGAPSPGSFRFRVYADGSLVRAEGSGSQWINLNTLGGAQSRVFHTATNWSLELCLPDSFTGGYNGQTVGFAFSHDNRDGLDDDTLWPRHLAGHDLSSWTPLLLGPDPDHPADNDHDGMPDAYEIATFGDTKQDPQDDLDRDGQSNLEECIAGTAPLDPQSWFRADSLTFSPGKGNTVAWTGQPGRSYLVQRSTDLESDWIQIGPARAGSGPLEVTDPDPPADEAYYRLIVSWPR